MKTRSAVAQQSVLSTGPFIWGGPLPPQDPWQNNGTFLSFEGGLVLGSPAGSFQGLGSINAEAIFIDGNPVATLDEVEAISSNTVTEVVTITSENTFAPLTNAPNGKVLILFINGQGYSAPTVTFAGNQLTWNSDIYTVQTTDTSFCLYSF